MNPRHPKTNERVALLLAGAVMLACSGGGSPMDQTPIDDPPVPPAPPEAPPPEGYAIYAVTLDNRLLLFGSASATAISKTVSITGLPSLRRIVGIDFRPSTGELYGIGNDSRLYILDRQTGAATAVATIPFEPTIASLFDVHFGMGFDPATERIRLIALESGTNWSVDPDDGTALRGQDVRYAAGDPNVGRRPAILGLAYTDPSVGTASARQTSPAPCDDPMWAIDAGVAELIASCDPHGGDFNSIVPIPVFSLAGCGELKFAPDGTLFATLLWRPEEGVELRSSLFMVDTEAGSVTWLADITVQSPIQSIAFDPSVPFQPATQSTAAARGVSVTRMAGGSCTGES